MKNCPVLLPLLLLLLSAPGAAREASPEEWADAFPFPPPRGVALEMESDEGIVLTVIPEEGILYFNRTEAGRGTTTVESPGEGTYWVEATAEGFASIGFWFNPREDSGYSLTITLPPRRGTLDLTDLPPDTEVRANRRLLEAGEEYRLSEGLYTLELSRFGYETVRYAVEIRQGDILRPEGPFTPRPLTLEELTLFRRRINPADPGLPGDVSGIFRVTAPGRGHLRVENNAGAILWERRWEEFAGSRHTFSWDPREGELPDGNYRLILTVENGGEKGLTEVRPLTVDSSAEGRHRSVYSGAAGLLLAPQAAPLAAGAGELGILVLYGPRGEIPYLPVQGGGRIAPFPGWEITAAVTAAAAEEPEAQLLALGLGIKRSLFSLGGGRFHVAALVKGAWQGPTTEDPLASYAGGALSLPVEGRIGPVRLLFTPEAHLSWRELVEPAVEEEGTGVYGRLYLRGGILVQGKSWWGGFSAAWRSSSFGGEWSDRGPWSAPLETAAEIHTTLSGSAIALSLCGTARITSLSEIRWTAGGGITVLF